MTEKAASLINQARQATQAAKTSMERGELLMKHLHSTAMKGGYEVKQSSLAVLLETGKFNCVSSTVLYYLVGTELGLKLQPIAIPGGLFISGHTALDLIEGNQRIQVEPTGPDGFDYEAKLKRPGISVWGPTPDRKKAVDISPLGLAAMTYSNRGVECIKSEPPRHLEALRYHLSALALDPTSANAAENCLAVLMNWGPELSKAGKTAEGVRVLQFGQKLSPDSRDLRENLEYVWIQHIDAALKAEKDAEVLTLVKQAARDLPQSREFQNPAESFERYGWKVYEEKGAEAALPVAARALKLLDDKGAAQMRDWRSGIYRRWSQQLLDKKDIEGSLKVLVRAHTEDKTSRNIQEGIGYHLQSALKVADEAGGVVAVTAHYQQVAKAFPGVEEVRDVAEAHARRVARSLAEEGKYAEAAKHLETYAALLPSPEQKADAAASIYDAWARALADEKKWEAALDKYAEGLKKFPKQVRLMNNAAVVVDRWADMPYREEKYDEAIRIYKLGLKLLPDHPGLKYNLKICEEKRDRK
jgi:tetratricopeptide (TPR) repeat protein